MSMYHSEQHLILSALSSALFRRPVRTGERVEWNLLFREATCQTVFPLVWSAVRCQVPTEVKAEWEPFFLRGLAANARVISAHGYVHRLLLEHNMPCVMMKGCASARYYPRPQLRVMGDVDFLVKREDVERCSEILESAGMTRMDDNDHPYHRNYWYQKVTYELHWEAPGIPGVDGGRIREYFKDIQEKAVLLDGAYAVPSDLHHGLIILLHNAGHMTAGGIGLRHLCDWAVYMDQMTDDFVENELAPCLKVCGLWEYARVLTAMGSRYLGASERSWADVDEKLVCSMMDDIWAAGNFGYKDAHRLNFRVLSRDTETRKIVRRGVLASLLKEVHLKAKKWYPGLTDRRITTPLAWCAVSGRYLKKLISGRRAPIRRKDIQTARKRQELFQQLGLFEECSDNESSGSANPGTGG